MCAWVVWFTSAIVRSPKPIINFDDVFASDVKASATKQLIRRTFKLLSRSIYPTNELLNHLSVLDLFTEEKLASIKQLKTAEDKNGELLRIIINVSPCYGCQRLLDSFLLVLKDHGQEHVTTIFRQGVGKQPMSDEHYELLTSKRAELSHFLDPFNGLVDNLRQCGVFAEIDVSRVSGLGNTNYDAPALEIINTVIHKSDCAFDKYVSELDSNGQEHVAHILTGKGEPPMSSKRMEILMKERQKLLFYIDSEHTSVVDKLFQNGVINTADKKRMDNQKGGWNKNEVLLNALVRKSFSAFDKFIDTLIANDHRQVGVAIHGLEIESVLTPILRGGASPVQKSSVTLIVRKCLENLVIMDREFDISVIFELLQSNGVNVSYVGEGSIIIRFRCLSKLSLLNLKELYVSGTLDRVFAETFLPSLRDDGLESLKFTIDDEKFERCAELFDELALMTTEHCRTLCRAAETITDRITVTEELLNKLPLCTKQKESVMKLKDNQEKVKLLLDIVSRKADIVYGQLIKVLRETHQDEAANFLVDCGESGENQQGVALGLTQFEECVSNMDIRSVADEAVLCETWNHGTDHIHKLRPAEIDSQVSEQPSMDPLERILFLSFILLLAEKCLSGNNSRTAQRITFNTLAGVSVDWSKTISNWKLTKTGLWIKKKLIPSCELEKPIDMSRLVDVLRDRDYMRAHFIIRSLCEGHSSQNAHNRKSSLFLIAAIEKENTATVDLCRKVLCEMDAGTVSSAVKQLIWDARNNTYPDYFFLMPAFHRSNVLHRAIGNLEQMNVSRLTVDLTPLHIAAYHGNARIARLLCQTRADVNCRCEFGLFAKNYFESVDLRCGSRNFYRQWMQLRLMIQEKTEIPRKVSNERIDVSNQRAINLTYSGYSKALKFRDDRIEEASMIPFPHRAFPWTEDRYMESHDLRHRFSGESEIIRVSHTALFAAIVSNYLQTAAELLKHSDTINMPCYWYKEECWKPLHVAICCGNAQMVKLLLDKQADVNARSSTGLTPLEMSTMYNNEEIVILLIDHVANINMATPSSHELLVKFCAELVIVLRRGNYINAIVNNNIVSLLTIANKAGNTDLPKLVENSILRLTSMTLLCHAIHNFSTEMVHLVIESGAELNQGCKPVQSIQLSYVTLSPTVIYPLHLAVLKGDKQVVNLLLERGATVDAEIVEQGLGNITPLHLAVKYSKIEVVELLLLHKANVNKDQSNGFNPLSIAAQNGHLKVLKLLIDSGADVNQGYADCKTPLEIAFENNYTEIIIELLKSGATVHDRILQHFPIHSAVRTHNKQLIQLLLRQGLEVDHEMAENDIHSITPLHMAAKEGRTGIVKTLVTNKASVNKLQSDGKSPLFVAVQNGHLAIVKLFLENGAEVNLQTLEISAKNKNTDVAHELPKSAASVKLSTKFSPLHSTVRRRDADVSTGTGGELCGITPLHVAAESGRLEIVKLLLTYNASVSRCKSDGSTPLHTAVSAGHIDIVKILLDSGAQVNATLVNGMTSLHIAATKGFAEIASELLTNGANVDARDALGATPLYLAARKCNSTLMNILLDAGADANLSLYSDQSTPLLAVFDSGVRDLRLKNKSNSREADASKAIHMFLTKKSDPNKRSVGKGTPLHYILQAMGSNYDNSDVNYATVDLLVRFGADVNARLIEGDDTSTTPLILACKYGYLTIIDLFLRNKGDINLADFENGTPLCAAVTTGYIRTVELLLRNCADVNFQTADGRTPFSIARRKGVHSVTEALLQHGAK